METCLRAEQEPWSFGHGGNSLSWGYDFESRHQLLAEACISNISCKFLKPCRWLTWWTHYWPHHFWCRNYNVRTYDGRLNLIEASSSKLRLKMTILGQNIFSNISWQKNKVVIEVGLLSFSLSLFLFFIFTFFTFTRGVTRVLNTVKNYFIRFLGKNKINKIWNTFPNNLRRFLWLYHTCKQTKLACYPTTSIGSTVEKCSSLAFCCFFEFHLFENTKASSYLFFNSNTDDFSWGDEWSSFLLNSNDVILFRSLKVNSHSMLWN